MEIPKNCLKKFKKTYNIYPSIIKINNVTINTNIEKYFSKFTTIWRFEVVGVDGSIITKHKLIDFDTSGLMVYILDNKYIFILTTESKMDVAKLTISTLKKL